MKAAAAPMRGTGHCRAAASCSDFLPAKEDTDHQGERPRFISYAFIDSHGADAWAKAPFGDSSDISLLSSGDRERHGSSVPSTSSTRRHARKLAHRAHRRVAPKPQRLCARSTCAAGLLHMLPEIGWLIARASG